ncbi:MAG: SDR family NAD(P)-dependent oxidoreductase [Chitinophagaceae bacterium]
MDTILNKFRSDNKIALVTGCSSDIGLAMALALAEAGADIIGGSHNMESEGEEVRNAVTATGRKFFPFQADFGNRKSLYYLIGIIETICNQIY